MVLKSHGMRPPSVLESVVDGACISEPVRVQVLGYVCQVTLISLTSWVTSCSVDSPAVSVLMLYVRIHVGTCMWRSTIVGVETIINSHSGLLME